MAMTKVSAVIIARGSSNPAFAQLTGCSATRSGTTATLTKTSHGRSNGDKVLIQGFDLEEFNGIFTVANAAANTFDYTIKQDPGANPSGTPGTLDKVTLGTAVDLSTCYGGMVIGGLQNGADPGAQAEIWMGQAVSGSADCDYVWRPMIGGGWLANVWTPFDYTIKQGAGFLNFAVARNTTNAVDCHLIANKITAV